ncbi:MAG TPA: PAS domain-containing protein, partial [Thermoanaerobaculia bacterium]
DRLLFPGAVHVDHMGRMAPMTAVNFAAVALALLFLDRPRGRRARDVVVLLVALDSLLVLFAYVYRVSEVSLPGGFGSVALNTSVAFLAVCTGALALRPEQGLAARLISDSFSGAITRRLLPAVLLVPLVLGWLRVVGEDRDLFDEGLGTALFAVAIVVLFGGIVFWSAERLSEAEAKRARAEETVAREKAILESILNSMGEAVIVADAEGRFVLFNPRAEEIMGLGAVDAPAADWSERYGLFLPDGSARYPPEDLPLARAIRGEEVKGTEILVRAPSRPDCIHMSVGRPLRDADGTIRGGVLVFHDITAEKKAAADREELIGQLTRALSEVKTLSGMLPICSSCKKIRDDKGYWNQIESYLHDHADAKFSHGLCPDCLRSLYPEFIDTAGAKPLA